MKGIVLTGFMGTGKTTVGRLLAARTGRLFVDTDELIVQRTGKEIARIFAEEGATHFRQLESEMARELAGKEGLVIATGGGLMLDPHNAAALSQNNLILCLAAEPDEILRRLAGDGARRPLLEGENPAERVAKLLRERADVYERFPQISTGEKEPDQVVDEIVESFHPGKINATAPPAERLTVTHPGGQYDVLVGARLLSDLRRLSGIGEAPVAIISDTHVAPLYAERAGEKICVLTIPAGEQHKTLHTVRGLYEQLLDAGLDRAGVIVALGGGVVGDVAGFVAATYMRGVPFIQCPTSLLAMVDASVGGKTGVDLPQGKNLVGAFKQPLAVLADVDTLRTLPPAEFAAGMAEVVKHGLLADESLLQRLEQENWMLTEGNPQSLIPKLQSLILDAIRVKRDVVQADPFEQGRRAILNLGHTFAHAIERLSDYAVPHGQAVAVGLVAATHLSAALGHCDPALQERLEALLRRLTLPTRIPGRLQAGHLQAEALYEAMGSDKKKVAGRRRYILIKGVGEAFIAEDVPRQAVLQTLRSLQSTGPDASAAADSRSATGR